MVNDVSLEYVKANPIPNAEEIKKLVTGADVMCITAMDNGASIPVGVHYLPKSVTGNQTFSNLEEAVKTIQVCKNCICRQNAVQHIIDWKDSGCDSFFFFFFFFLFLFFYSLLKIPLAATIKLNYN